MHSVRVLVLGAPAVGKTSLIEVLVSHSVLPLRPHADSQPVYNLTAVSDGLILCVSLQEAESDSLSTARLMTADAYVLLFDLTSPASFQFVRLLRDQLFEGRSSRTPVFVVGNKSDLVPVRRTSGHQSEHHSQGSHWEPAVGFRELSALIRKQWKSSYWEVSALHHWHMQSLLQRILQSVSHSRLSDDPPVTRTHAAPQPQHSPHCLIL